MMMKSANIALAALGLASQVYGQASMCGGDVCYQVAVPDSSEDLFFQIAAPNTYQWVGTGPGNQMAGALMFIMYQSADGKGVTVGPRTTRGNVMPTVITSGITLTLLDGSGVNETHMTANVKCTGCSTWTGGSAVDLSSNSASWVYARRTGSAIQSDELDATIRQHGNSYGTMTWDFTAAKVSNSDNPFVAAAVVASSSVVESATSSAAVESSTAAAMESSTAAGMGSSTAVESSTAAGAAATTAAGASSTSGTMSTATSPTGTAGAYGAGSGTTSGSSDSDSQEEQDAADAMMAKQDMVTTAHAVMASLAFLVLFPTGGILIRVANFTGLVWVHAAIQAVALVVFTVAFGMGVWLANGMGYISEAHPIIGIVLFAVLLLQPALGWLHHKYYKAKGMRTAWSWGHIGIGRIAIILGMINGGLGLQLAEDTTTGHVAAYSVVAAVFGLAYIASIIFGEVKMKKNKVPGQQKSTAEGSNMS